MLTGKATTHHRVCLYVCVCARESQCEITDESLSFSSLGSCPVVHSLRGTIILYMEAVQHIYSLPIYLTATKACRLTGLPVATLNEELDPA